MNRRRYGNQWLLIRHGDSAVFGHRFIAAMGRYRVAPLRRAESAALRCHLHPHRILVIFPYTDLSIHLPVHAQPGKQ
jgi:hypothetical protein